MLNVGDWPQTLGRVQGVLGFSNSREVAGDIGRAGSVEWVGEH